MKIALEVLRSLRACGGSFADVEMKREQIKKSSAIGLADLAALATDLRQGDSFEALPVYVEVACGRPTLRLGDHEVQLGTRQVMLRITLKNADIKAGSVPHVMLQEGTFSMDTTRRQTVTSARQMRLGIDMAADAGVTKAGGIERAGMSLKGQVARDGNRAAQTEEQTQAKIEPEIAIIYKAGRAIAIGDDRQGDPRQADGCLCGAYPRPADSDGPMLILEPRDPKQPVTVSITTAVPRRKLEVSRQNASIRRRFPWTGCQPSSEEIQAEASQRGETAAAEHLEALRTRMMSDAVADKLIEVQRTSAAHLGLEDGEFAVEIETFQVVPLPQCGNNDEV